MSRSFLLPFFVITILVITSCSDSGSGPRTSDLSGRWKVTYTVKPTSVLRWINGNSKYVIWYLTQGGYELSGKSKESDSTFRYESSYTSDSIRTSSKDENGYYSGELRRLQYPVKFGEKVYVINVIRMLRMLALSNVDSIAGEFVEIVDTNYVLPQELKVGDAALDCTLIGIR